MIQEKENLRRMDARAAIQDAGMRVTRQRVAVLEAVQGRPHVSAAVVLAHVAGVLPDVSHQAVYDCLAHLTAAGLLRRFTMDGGPMLYETRTEESHHHFVCRTCNAVVDVDFAVAAAPRLDVPLGEGFVIDEAEVTYRGFCPDCAVTRDGNPA
jgi:Fe2+ or Zn2+ uptake regulation protein